MMDSRCVPISYDDPAVLARYDATLTELHRFADDPVAAIEDILIEHPDFALGHIFRAVCFAGGSAARYIPEMEHSLSHAEAIGTPLNDRERGLIAAVRRRCTGDWRGAQLSVEAILTAFPRDSLALHFGHQLDFLLGDALNLRGRVERVLPYWDSSVPNYSHVLGMHAFGLEESNLFEHAEMVGREACALDHRDAWAHHAVGHVIEMQGRHKEGIVWYDSHETGWAASEGLSIHNWWHLCLYLMEEEDYQRIFEIYDDHLAPGEETESEALTDSTALLWRLTVQGVDVGTRWQAIGERWRELIEIGEGGYYSFNDFHAALSFAALDWGHDLAGLEDQVIREAGRDNTLGQIACEVGMPLILSIKAYQEERYEAALEQLEAVRPIVIRFGGSNAQRDLIDQTMLSAALLGGLGRWAVGLANERLIRKPHGPLAGRFSRRAHAIAG